MGRVGLGQPLEDLDRVVVARGLERRRCRASTAPRASCSRSACRSRSARAAARARRAGRRCPCGRCRTPVLRSVIELLIAVTRPLAVRTSPRSASTSAPMSALLRLRTLVASVEHLLELRDLVVERLLLGVEPALDQREVLAQGLALALGGDPEAAREQGRRAQRRKEQRKPVQQPVVLLHDCLLARSIHHAGWRCGLSAIGTPRGDPCRRPGRSVRSRPWGRPASAPGRCRAARCSRRPTARGARTARCCTPRCPRCRCGRSGRRSCPWSSRRRRRWRRAGRARWPAIVESSNAKYTVARVQVASPALALPALRQNPLTQSSSSAHWSSLVHALAWLAGAGLARRRPGRTRRRPRTPCTCRPGRPAPSGHCSSFRHSGAADARVGAAALAGRALRVVGALDALAGGADLAGLAVLVDLAARFLRRVTAAREGEADAQRGDRRQDGWARSCVRARHGLEPKCLRHVSQIRAVLASWRWRAARSWSSMTSPTS